MTVRNDRLPRAFHGPTKELVCPQRARAREELLGSDLLVADPADLLDAVVEGDDAVAFAQLLNKVREVTTELIKLES